MAEIISNSDIIPLHHVAVLTFPFSSHATTVFAIVSRLAAACGGNTLFSFFSTAQANKSLFSSSTSTSTPNLKSYDVTDGVPQGYVLSSGSPLEKISMFVDTAPQSFKNAMEAAVDERGKPITCLITDAFLWFGGEIAEEMGVPWVAAWVSAGMTLYTHILTDDIREAATALTNPSPNKEITFVPGMSDIRIRDLPTEVLSGDWDSPVHRMLQRMGQTLPLKADVVLINSIEELESVVIANHLRSKLKCPLVVPFYYDLLPSPLPPPPPPVDTYGCLSWLDKQKPASVVYIAFGFVFVPPPNELVALREALEATGVPFLWSFSNKDNLKTTLFPIGTTKGMAVLWAPQKKVLSHEAVGVFVSHGGWNSVLESVVGGVPMICRPIFADHLLNSRTMEAVWKTGIPFEVFTKEEVMSSLDLILNQQVGKGMREKLGAMKQVVQAAIGLEGSSLKNFKKILNFISGNN